MKRLIWSISLVFLWAVASSQVVVGLEAAQDKVVIGDPITLRYSITPKAGDKVVRIDFSALDSMKNVKYEQLPDELDEYADYNFLDTYGWRLTGSKKILEGEEIISGLTDEGSSKIVHEIKIGIYSVGVFDIPNPVVTTEKKAAQMFLETPRISVGTEGIAVPTDSLPLQPIKPIIEEGRALEDFLWLFYGLGALLVLGAVGWLLYRFRYKKEEEIVEVPEIIIPPHVKALSNLKILRQEELWQKGKIKAYQSELTRIIREYLEGRFAINALEMTSDEIIRNLSGKDFDVQYASKLKNILQIADLVKFAKAKPSDDIHEQFMDEAIEFVEDTKKNEEEEETE